MGHYHAHAHKLGSVMMHASVTGVSRSRILSRREVMVRLRGVRDGRQTAALSDEQHVPAKA